MSGEKQHREVQANQTLEREMTGARARLALIANGTSHQQTNEIQDQPEIVEMPVGEIVERQLKGGQIHYYRIGLKQGQVLQLAVREKGVDVVIVFARLADAHRIKRVDFGFGYNRETLTFVAQQTTDYVALIGSPKSPMSGSYQLEAQVGEVTASDRQRIEAERLFEEGLECRDKRTAEGLRKAIAKFEEALLLWKAIGDKYWEGNTNNFLGLVNSALEDKQKALYHYNQALILFRAIGDQRGEASTLNNIGSAYDALSEKQAAIDYYNQSLLPFRAVGDRRGEAVSLNNIGGIYSTLGEKEKALDFLSRALVSYIVVNDKAGQAKALNNIGTIYSDLGELQKALDFLNQALSSYIDIGDQKGQAETLSNIGELYYSLGEPQKALDYLNQSLTSFNASGDKRRKATVLNNISLIYYDTGEKQKALDLLNQALKLQQEVGDQGGEARALMNISHIYNDSGERQKASGLLNRALQLFRAIGDKGGEASTLSNLGFMYTHSNESYKALGYYSHSLLLYRAVGDRQGEANVMNNTMLIWDSLGNRRMAIFYGKLSINARQELRNVAQRLDNSIQKSFLRSMQYQYKLLVEIMIKENQFEQAVQILNLLQDQQFFDFDHQNNSPVQQAVLSPREQAFARRYETTNNKIGQINSQIGALKLKTGNLQPDAQETSKLEAELKTATDEFVKFLGDSETEFAKPRDEMDEPAEVTAVTEMQSALRELDAATKQKTATLYTLIGGNKFYILLITPDDKVKVFESTIEKASLNTKIRRFYDALRSPTQDPRPLGKELYDIILKPVEAELRKSGAQTLMWQLDGSLRYVPMAALWDGKKYLVERFHNVAFTRANRERMTRSANPYWTGTGFGSSQAQTVDLLGDKISFPPLPGVTRELRTIFRTAGENAGILDGEVFADKQFNKNTFYEAMKKRRPLVHISSHFAFRPGDDSRSFLLLGDGAALTLSEMKQQEKLFEGVDLLTLSACNTAAAQADANGREIDGFAELAQRLGAGAVMATLWSVADDSTSALMSQFYRLRKENPRLTKAEALQIVQKAMLQGKYKAGETALWRGPVIAGSNNQSPPFKRDNNAPYAHPYFWSPFVLIGNWK